MCLAPVSAPGELQLRADPDPFELWHQRLTRLRIALVDLGLDAGDVDHLDPGDVAIPLPVLERLVELAAHR